MRSLNLDQLRAFVEVVERGSFTAAAKELNLTQPAVTHQVQELERRFALPIEDPAFETVPLFNDELVAILPAALGQVPKKVTPAFLSQCPLILGSENSALRRTIADWLALASPPPRPLMEFDNVEAMKSVVAVGLGASIVPSLSLGAGHVIMANTLVRPLSPRASRQVGLVRLRGKRGTDGMELVSAALLTLRRRPAARSG